MSDSNDRLNQLSDQQRELLERMLLARKSHAEVPTRKGDAAPGNATARDAADAPNRWATKKPTIARRGDSQSSVLSQAESRLWFVDRLEPNDPFYNMPLAVRITGPFLAQAFTRAINAIVARHETLRCTYHLVDGTPQRRIAPSLTITPEFIDSPDISASELDQRIRHESRKPFQVETGPLLRVTVFRTRADEHVVLLGMHHIVSDGWSMYVMLRELRTLYAAFAAADSSPGNASRENASPESNSSELALPQSDTPLLAPLPIQYSDFAQWQHETQTPTAMQAHRDYWIETLRGAPETLNLATDRPRPAVQDFNGATYEFEISAQHTASLRRLAQANDCTPYMVLLAIEALLLARIASQSEIVLGTAIANRTLPELESLIGFFVGTLPMRIDISGNPSFAELLQRVRRTSLDAYAHAAFPFEQMVEELASHRDRSYSPIFQAAMVMQNFPDDLSIGQNPIEPIHIDNGTSKYELTFFLWDHGDRLRGHVEYRTGLFDRQTIAELVESYQTLLAAALDQPTQTIHQLPITSANQAHRVLEEFNPPPTEVARPHRMNLRIDLAATERRQSEAIWDAGLSLSYQQLIDAADHLASTFQSMGMQDRDRIVVVMPRSAQLITVMLAIWKAGGVYVPLDPSVPTARIESLIEETDATWVISQVDIPSIRDASIRPLDDVFAQFNIPESGPTVFCLRESDAVASEPDETHLSTPNADNLDQRHNDGDDNNDCDSDRDAPAYIIFTSGSTGKPKGVQIEHRALVNFVDAQTSVMGVKSCDRVLHGFSPSFDGAISEVLLALANGAAVVVAPDGSNHDPERLQRLLDDQRVSVGKFPPALLSMLDNERLPHLKTVASAGDKLSAELAKRWSVGRRFFNGYGPTEATVGVSMMELSQTIDTPRPPIGRAMANMRMYVLDAHQQPVPVGVPGEIYIGGMGVSKRGYLNRPQLNQAVFLPDPFVSQSGARMYRTGDLGRWLPTGVVEFLGRVDDQISLRGFRIEPSEVAAALENLPLVHQAVVVANHDQASTQLIAYVVPASPSGRDSQRQQIEHEHVDAWNHLFDNAHRAAPLVADPQFNTIGWISTYTGRPLPSDQMRQWVDETCQRIATLNPRRVLEIGCGTGLILLKLAGQCDSYVGTDLLASSLENVQEALKQRPELNDIVELKHLRADQLSELGDRRFDLIVLNSVVQYFPSVGYLYDTLVQATGLLSPGGHLFVGDVRNLRLQQAFAASVETYQAAQDTSAHLTAGQMRQRIASRIDREEELLLDPMFFDLLPRHIGRITDVQSRLKESSNDNELTRFRYDVLLRMDQPVESHSGQSIEWNESLDWDRFATQLKQSPQRTFTLCGVLNDRVSDDVRRAAKLATMPDPAPWNASQDDAKGDSQDEQTASQSPQTESQSPQTESQSPQTESQSPQTESQSTQTSKRSSVQRLQRFAKSCDRSVRFTWNVQDPAAMDAVFEATTTNPENESEDHSKVEREFQGENESVVDGKSGRDKRWAIEGQWSSGDPSAMASIEQSSPDELRQWGNNPLASRLQQQLASQLREQLKLRLPAYMIPQTFVSIDEIPRTINGKIDPTRLPRPIERPQWATGYEPPRDEYESLVAEVWQDVLDVPRVGRKDNFFELGGHSMLAVRMMSQIEKQSGRSLPLAALFSDPTPAHLATLLKQDPASHLAGVLVPLRPTGTQSPLFCIHPAGGTVFCYMQLASHISDERPVYGLQAQGVDGIKQAHDTVEQMASCYVQAIVSQHPQGPLHLAGWSLGGNIAFEVARQLHALGRSPSTLALLDSGLLNDQQSLSEEDFLPLIMALFPDAQNHFSLEQLRQESPQQQLQYFIEHAAQAGIIPAAQAEHAQHVFQVFQSNVKAVHRYRGQPFPGTITLFRPQEQSKTAALFDDPRLGWTPFADQVQVAWVPGDHARMLQAPAVIELAQMLSQVMASNEAQ